MYRSIFPSSSEVPSSHGLLVAQCSRAMAPESCREGSLCFVSHHPPDVGVVNSIPRD